MIIVPLGLGRKLPRFPVLTLLLAVLTVGISALHFRNVKLAHHTSTQLSIEQDLSTKRLQLVGEYCPHRRLSASQCETTQGLLRLAAEAQQDKSLSREDQDRRIEGVLVSHTRRSPASGQALEREMIEISEFLLLVRRVDSIVDPVLLSLPAWAPYQAARERQQQGVRDMYERLSLLSRQTVSVVSVALAQFTHASFFHLFGNLVFFIGFCMYLEQRLKARWILLIYFVGGTAGLLSEILLFSNADRFLLGSSANVSAVMGAFFVVYFHKKMRVLLSLLVWNRVVFVPVALVFPVLFIAGDVAGLLGSSHSGGGVAHFAHLVGLGCGVGIGWLATLRQPLSPTCLYPEEQRLQDNMTNAPDLDHKMEVAEQVLSYNSENWPVIEEIANEATLLSESELPPSARIFLGRYLGAWFASAARTGREERACELLQRVPEHWNLRSWLGRLSPKDILQLADGCLKMGQKEAALRLYDLHESHFPKGVHAEGVRRTMEVLQTQVTSSGPGESLLAFKGYRSIEDHSIYPLAKPSRRILAYLLDLVFSTALNSLAVAAFKAVFGVMADRKFSGTYLVLTLVVYLVYWCAPVYFDGQTFGKRLIGLKVIGTDNRPILAFWQVILRETLGRWLSFLFLGVGFLGLFLRKDRCGWHDRISQTRVIDLKERL